jgi:hypothetical protein
MFQKGDPRICRDRTSREPIIAQAQKLAAENMPEALKFLVEVMRDETRSTKARTDAAIYLINRAAGSPVSVNVLADIGQRQGLDGFNPVAGVGDMNAALTQLEAAAPASLSDAELELVVRNGLNGKGDLLPSPHVNKPPSPGDDIVDGEYEELPRIAANQREK